jgi:hypothetical protein
VTGVLVTRGCIPVSGVVNKYNPILVPEREGTINVGALRRLYRCGVL